MTIQQIQAAIDSKANDSRQLINMIADYLQDNTDGGPSPSLSYLVYTAALTQTGTDAPVATVLQNTLGGTVTWTRNQEGQYFAITAGLFTVGKTFMPPFGASGYSILQYSSIGYTQGFAFDANQFNFETYADTSFTYKELSVILGASGIVMVEIRVYP